jgi:lysophospholipase L1-like esterase
MAAKPSLKQYRWALLSALLGAVLGACGGGSGGSARDWVGTWTTAPLCYQAATILGLPRTARFSDQSVRMVVRTSIGGESVRVKLTNQCGETPLQIGTATVGIRDSGASILPDTSRALSFDGSASIDVPAGSTVTSDPVDLALPALTDLAITLYLPGETVPTTSHPQAARSYVSGSGDFTATADGAAFPTIMPHWIFLDAVEVLPEREGAAIVALGDSVTEGTGTTFDANRRWPDFLARRLVAADKNLGVLNQGINGNKVLNSLLGGSALVRFDKDVLDQAGVRYVILLEGINDIGLGSPDVTADQIIAGYRELIQRAHDNGLEIFGGTLTPAEGNAYTFYEPYEESKRVAVNRFIRESGEFDAVIDFANAVEDPANPSRWRPGFSGDALHPSDAGAEALANAVDLALFD